jgi:POT family proton-dependent oligopeptide transporter
MTGLIMGVWFLSISVGDYIGGRLSGLYESFPLPALFGVVVAFCLLIGGVLVLLLRPMRKLMGDVN